MTTARSDRACVVVGTMFHRDLAEKVAWLDLDDVMALLQTVGLHLEGKSAGSRFPLLWQLEPALAYDEPCEWSNEELGPLVVELDTIEKECESVAATLTPTFAFGDEGLPDVYSHQTPRAQGTARLRFQSLLVSLRAFAQEALRQGQALAIERRGAAIEWWDTH